MFTIDFSWRSPTQCSINPANEKNIVILPRVFCRAVVGLVVSIVVQQQFCPLHRLMTDSVATWLRPFATAACGAPTGHPLATQGPWPHWRPTSCQTTRQCTRALLWPCTSCPRNPTIASPCTKKEWSRSVVLPFLTPYFCFFVDNLQSSYFSSLFAAFETKSGIITLRKMCFGLPPPLFQRCVKNTE